MTKAVWDSSNKGSDILLSGNGLTAEVIGGTNYSTRFVKSNLVKAQGKYYLEVKLDALITTGNWRVLIGCSEVSSTPNGSGILTGRHTLLYAHNGDVMIDGIISQGQIDMTSSTGDIIGIALDLDNKKIGFYKNGVFQGKLFDYNGASAVVFVEANTIGMKWSAKFSRTSFEYSIPEGFVPYQLPINKTLILSKNEYQKYGENGWESVSSVLPNQAGFEEHGMDNLGNLDRTVQTAGVFSMTNDGALGEGNLFRGAIDLKKYFDLRKIEVK